MPVKNSAECKVSYLQILDENGNLDSSLEPDIPKDKLLKLYRFMWLAREADSRMLKLQRQGRIGTFGLNTGHEAVSGAVAIAMSDNDWFVESFRELAGMLIRGVSLANFYLFHNGYEEGNVVPDGSRILPISIIVGSQTLHAVGIGYAIKYRGEKDTAVVTFLGDGGTSQGDFHEALNFASVWQVPVVFVIQNNQWAISVPRRMQSHSRTLAQKAFAYDIPCVQVDGNDPLAVYSAAKEALARAKSGGGPTLIEAVTYRLLMHTTADDPKKYRNEDEVSEWWKKEPLIRTRMYLESKGIWNDNLQKAMELEITEHIENAVKEYEGRSDLKPDIAFDNVFGTRHAVIEEQREEYLENIRRGKEDG